ncbi:hypothetical protein D3C78_1843640 [compost metagenome]
MEIHPPVRLAAVQEDRDRHDGDVRQRQRVQDDLPPGSLGKAPGKEGEELIHIAFCEPRLKNGRQFSLPGLLMTACLQNSFQ